MNDEMKNKMLVIVGGPGSSGSSTISKMLSAHFNIERVYAGSIFRQHVSDLGYKTLDDFYSEADEKKFFEIDKEIDNFLIERGKKGNVLIESKVFAALATLNNIPSTVKIWLTASLFVRTKRLVNKQKDIKGISRLIYFVHSYFSLLRRRMKDGKRYKDLYGVAYCNQELYNNIVLDTSKLNEKETFDLILKKMKDGGYIK